MKKQRNDLRLALVMVLLFSMTVQPANACTRLLYETGTGTYITARSMDWNDPELISDLWVFPQGIQRKGGGSDNELTWKSKYGSVITAFYGTASADGMNEKGLVGNTQYLTEADFGDPAKTGKPTISIGAWLQYFLDNYASVEEAVAAMQDPPFTVVSKPVENGLAATIHMAISDATGDPAIFEYLDGELVIHHGPQYVVMTNSPIYSGQLALNAYWEKAGGENFLPGTASATDRWVRASYYLKTMKNRKTGRWRWPAIKGRFCNAKFSTDVCCRRALLVQLHGRHNLFYRIPFALHLQTFSSGSSLSDSHRLWGDLLGDPHKCFPTSIH